MLVTLALIAMCGMLGLAVDLGWSYFVRKNAQSFADAAALAAVEQALKSAGQAATFSSCPPKVNCAAVGYSCGPGIAPNPDDNLDNACLYARGTTTGPADYTGFVDGTNGSRTQTALVDSGLGQPPGIPIKSKYWVRVRLSEQIPQLFSAVLGKGLATSGAIATAAIVDLPVQGSVILTNRMNESSPVGRQGQEVVGKNLFVDVNSRSSLTVPGGIMLNSDNSRAGEIGDASGNVIAGFTWTVPAAGDVYDPIGRWTASRRVPVYPDPLGGKGQPPVTTTQLPDCPVQGGLIDGGNDPDNPLVLAPGNYYATHNGVPTWNPVQFKGNVRLAACPNPSNTLCPPSAPVSSPIFTYEGKTTAPCLVGVTGAGSGFGDYFFYGGFYSSSWGANLVIEPGRYVIAGVKQGSGTPNDVLRVNSNMSVVDLNPALDPPSNPNAQAGELFIVTDPSYPNVSAQFANIPALQGASQNLTFGTTFIEAGSGITSLQLHGLTPGNSTVETANNGGLKPFAQVLFWQDQHNSRVQYYANTGLVDWSHSCAGTRDSPCPNLALSGSRIPQFSFSGSETSKVFGIFYQPRGAWMILKGNANPGNLKAILVSGSLQVGGILSLASISQPPAIPTPVLVQ